MSRLELKPCPKVYIRDTHRSRMPEETLRFIEDIRNCLALEDFRNITEVDRIGLPVYVCRRTRPDESVTFHTGKGISDTQAQVSLIMESIERYCSEYKAEDRHRLIWAPFDELRKKHLVLDPRDLILSPFSEYSPKEPFFWVEGFDLISGEIVLVPSCSVFHPFHEDTCTMISTHTNGVASGNTMEEAVLHGLLEVIERDALSIVKCCGHQRERVIIEPVEDNNFLFSIQSSFLRADIDLTLYDYTSDLGIPVIAARAQDMVDVDMMPMDGFGAHLDPRVAAARAMMEVATTRALLIHRFGVHQLREAPIPYLEPELYSDVEETATITLGEMGIGFSQDIHTDILAILNRLRDKGLEKVIVVNLTKEGIGVPTVRVIVAGAEVFAFDKSRRGERLFNG